MYFVLSQLRRFTAGFLREGSDSMLGQYHSDNNCCMCWDTSQMLHNSHFLCGVHLGYGVLGCDAV
jgi:hypothetical protein